MGFPSFPILCSCPSRNSCGSVVKVLDRRPTENTFFIFGGKRKCRRKWNSIFVRKTKTKVICAYITELSYGSIANITFWPNANDIFEMKAKINKQKMKIHFRPKTKKSRKWQKAHIRRRKRKRISVGFYAGLSPSESGFKFRCHPYKKDIGGVRKGTQWKLLPCTHGQVRPFVTSASSTLVCRIYTMV